MINRLKILYELQNIDDQLDELEDLRGDLPNAVEALEAKINGIKNEVSAKTILIMGCNLIIIKIKYKKFYILILHFW